MQECFHFFAGRSSGSMVSDHGTWYMQNVIMLHYFCDNVSRQELQVFFFLLCNLRPIGRTGSSSSGNLSLHLLTAN